MSVRAMPPGFGSGASGRASGPPAAGGRGGGGGGRARPRGPRRGPRPPPPAPPAGPAPGRGAPRPAWGDYRSLHAVLAQLLPQRGAVDAQDGRGARLLSARQLEDPLDVHLLQFLQAHAREAVLAALAAGPARRRARRISPPRARGRAPLARRARPAPPR